MNFEQIKAEIGYKLRGTSLMFDLVNTCTFVCPSCPVGNIATRKGAKMSFEMFCEILDKVESQTKIRYILLYSFSEPFNHNELGKIVGEVKRRGIRCMISTNLSRPKQLPDVLEAGLDELRISFSGWDKGEYFHMGRDMKQFMEAMDYLATLIPKHKTKVGLIFHRYATNFYEQERAKKYAEDRGMYLIPETAFFIPFETIVRKEYTDEDKKLIGHLIQTPEETTKDLPYREYCYYQQKQIVIDATGEVFLCRHVYKDEFIVGNILNDSLNKIRKTMMRNDFCVQCKNHKLNTGAYTP